MSKVSIDMIAKRLNVNKSTVSRTLNNKAGVSEAKRKLILEEAEKLKYMINYNAKNVRGKGDLTVGVYIETEGANSLSPYIMSEKILGISNYFCEHNYRVVIICRDDFLDNPELLWKYIFEKGIKGLISLSHIDEEVHRNLKKYNLPHVMLNWTSVKPAENEAFVMTRPGESIRLLINHMIGKGYRDIGIINWYTLFPQQKNIVEEIDKLKIANPDLCIEIWNTDLTRTREDINEYMESTNHRAYISMHYQYGFWVMDWLKSKGKSIPKDVAVATHDYNPIMEIYSPKITGVMQPTKKLAKIAARKLKDIIENDERRYKEYKVPEFIFVEGETT